MNEKQPGRGAVLFALAVVYVIWGSTYLAIRFAVETLPPFFMAAVRFLIAGSLLYGWRRWRGAPRPDPRQWKAAAVVGLLMLLGGNGAVVWAEQWVESGTAALVVATVPLWMVLLDWMRPGGRPPRARVWLGIGVGLAGVVLLLGAPDAGERYVAGWAVLILGSISWAAGSLYSRSATMPGPMIATGMQMLAGGAGLALAGLLTGEAAALDPSSFSTKSVLALVYLIVFGALAGYSAYIWLLRVTTPAVASTYAYVNPVVAVFLGWLLAAERVTPRIVVASAVIVGAVAVITTTRTRPPAVGGADLEPERGP